MLYLLWLLMGANVFKIQKNREYFKVFYCMGSFINIGEKEEFGGRYCLSMTFWFALISLTIEINT